MSPKPKSVPSRLGPPPQLAQLNRIPIINQQQKFEPKMREIFGKQAKILARWVHQTLTWKKILMSWMVILVASKMVLLMLTYEFFSLTALISLQIFHGVWTIAFFCLTVIESRAILPNASCLLAGYLPATTVLHILLIPNNYPLEYIITDAVGTFLAIITMFLLLRMECTEILHEAEELWERHSSETSSEVGSASTGSSDIGDMTPPRKPVHQHKGPPQAIAPTIITVNGVTATAASGLHNLDSFLYNSMDEPSGDRNNNVVYNLDLEPIDFEHFVDEPDLGRNRSENNMFRVTFVETPPLGRGR